MFLRHRRSKRINESSLLGRRLFFVVGVFFVMSVACTGTASAMGLFDNIQAVHFGPLQAKEKRMYELQQELVEKQKELKQAEPVVEKVKSETSKVVEKADKLETKVDNLKKNVAKLQGMFVHINKYASDSGGNTYAPGNCTWYVKSVRPDISNSWGNANTWYVRAQAQGWKVGTTPKKGAVATTTAGWAGHVAYVTGVSPDGKWVTIKEMNVNGLYNMGKRTVYYTEFKYIYELD